MRLPSDQKSRGRDRDRDRNRESIIIIVVVIIFIFILLKVTITCLECLPIFLVKIEILSVFYNNNNTKNKYF